MCVSFLNDVSSHLYCHFLLLRSPPTYGAHSCDFQRFSAVVVYFSWWSTSSPRCAAMRMASLRKNMWMGSPLMMSSASAVPKQPDRALRLLRGDGGEHRGRCRSVFFFFSKEHFCHSFRLGGRCAQLFLLSRATRYHGVKPDSIMMDKVS